MPSIQIFNMKANVIDMQFIESRTEKIPFSGCWIWMRGLSSSGYGSLMVDKKPWSAHRFSYSVFKGSIPDGHFVMHRCDTKCCVNPAHLSVGTPLDNLVDSYTKERKGKLTAAIIEEMKRRMALGESMRSVAKFFNVHYSAIVWRKRHGTF